MPLITYIEADGRDHEVEVEVGQTVMQGAVNNMVDGIVAECGGSRSCATCHCYVDGAWIEKVGPAASAEEDDMLDAVLERKDGSRLSCQITVTEELNGLVVHVPASQL